MNKRTDNNVIITFDKLKILYEIGVATSNMGGSIPFIIFERPEKGGNESEQVQKYLGYEFDITTYDGFDYLEKELTEEERQYFRQNKRNYTVSHSGEWGVMYKKVGGENIKDRFMTKKKERKKLKKKLYLCNVKGCSWKGPILSKGMCPYHYGITYNKEKGSKARETPKNSYDEFFKKHVEILKNRPYSDYKMTPIKNPSRKNICHILPKREAHGFPSMGEVDDNIVYLTWQQHHDMDKWLDNREYHKLKANMPELYELILKRLPSLLDEAEERNKYYYDLKKLLESEQEI